jgi:hypothetical protein
VGDPAGQERKGLSPVARLDPGCLDRPPAGFRAAVEASLVSREEGPFVHALLAEIVTRGHHAWLVGGSVRDLLSPGPASQVKDFDLTGTIGPASLDEIAMVRLRRRLGVGDYIPSWSDQNIWSVKARSDGPRLVEYKPLSLPRLAPLAWGGALDDDVTTRDLTFNALYYDWQHDVLADPCGQGRADLRDRVMDTPYPGNGPFEVATIIVRSLKFLLRYPGIGTSRMVTWIEGTLPDDFAARLTPNDWKRLVRTRVKSVLPELSGRSEKDSEEEEEKAARELGNKAVSLLRELKLRTGP